MMVRVLHLWCLSWAVKYGVFIAHHLVFPRWNGERMRLPKCQGQNHNLFLLFGQWDYGGLIVVGKVVGLFWSWAEQMRRLILKIMLSSRIGKLGEGPKFKAITSAKDTRRPKDEHMLEHLIGIRHKLLSNPLKVRRLGPTSDNRFYWQE